MSKATYWQRGETLDYVNIGTETIEANTIISFSNHIGVAGTEIFPNEVGTLHVTGVFEMPKTATGAIEMGTEVYFDGTGITDAQNDGATTNPVAYVLAGYAAQAAAASDTVILVKLIG
ncbi:MAG: DUF2190 family protein [Lachnospiraceae bacterium]